MRCVPGLLPPRQVLTACHRSLRDSPGQAPRRNLLVQVQVVVPQRLGLGKSRTDPACMLFVGVSRLDKIVDDLSESHRARDRRRWKKKSPRRGALDLRSSSASSLERDRIRGIGTRQRYYVRSNHITSVGITRARLSMRSLTSRFFLPGFVPFSPRAMPSISCATRPSRPFPSSPPDRDSRRCLRVRSPAHKTE